MYYFEIIDEFVRSSMLIFVIIMEISAAVIILYSAIPIIIKFLRFHNSIEKNRLNLADSLSFALEFVLGAEILRTIVARTWSELGIVAMVILIRAGLAILIHWEIKQKQFMKNPEH